MAGGIDSARDPEQEYIHFMNSHTPFLPDTYICTKKVYSLLSILYYIYIYKRVYITYLVQIWLI